MFMFGASLGANVVANYLGEEENNCIFTATCCL
jgi:predicted alpha/beta-fold hydrolase